MLLRKGKSQSKSFRKSCPFILMMTVCSCRRKFNNPLFWILRVLLSGAASYMKMKRRLGF